MEDPTVPSRPSGAQPTSPLDAELAAVLGAYLGDLLEGRRVAILGDGSSPLATQIAEATGRRVQVYDPDPRRTAAAIARTRGETGAVRYALLEADAALDPDSLLGRGAFDAVLIPDLADLVHSGRFELDRLLQLAEGMLGPRGFAAVATSRSEDAIDYVGLYEEMSARFASVQMLGAAPFVGVTVATFGGDGAPAVAIDSSLTEGSEEPLAYLAVGSRQPLRLEPYLVVQLPWEDVLDDSAAVPQTARRPGSAPDATVAEVMARLREAEADAAARGETIAALSMRIAELESGLAAAQEEHLEAVEDKQRELDAILERVGELETELESRREEPAPTAPSEDESAGALRQVQALEFQLAELRRSLSEARSEADALRPAAAKVRELEAERSRLESRLAAAEAACARADDEAAASEATAALAELEARLRERGERLRALERDLREAERTGKELVRELAAARAAPPEASVSEDVRKLAERSAELEAELQASRWKIESLERELGEGHTPGDEVARLEDALHAATNELAALKQSRSSLEADHEG